MSAHQDMQSVLEALEWYEALAQRAVHAFMRDDDGGHLVGGIAMRLAADAGDRAMKAQRVLINLAKKGGSMQ